MEFEAFKKIARIEKLSNKVIITEKIDGTNAQVAFDDEGKMWVGSRNRWLVPQTAEVPKGSDNFGFAEWCRENEDELRKLGKGRHYGEWFGRGIGPHGYGLTDRRFALFNTRRWGNPDQVLPACVEVVPVLFEGVAGSVQELVEELLLGLAKHGSRAVPGFREPEGVVAYLPALDLNFKSLLYGSRGGAKKHPSPIESIPEATK